MRLCCCGCGLRVKAGRQRVHGHGRKHPKRTFAEVLDRKVDRSGECWPCAGKPNWTGHVPLTVDGRPRKAHRLAWEVASGAAVPDGFIVCHTCDNPACCRNDDHGVYLVDGVEYERWGHLWLGTVEANNRDSAIKGRKPSGDAHWTRRG